MEVLDRIINTYSRLKGCSSIEKFVQSDEMRVFFIGLSAQSDESTCMILISLFICTVRLENVLFHWIINVYCHMKSS